MWNHNPERVPGRSPAISPAWDKSVQGKPAVTQSGRPSSARAACQSTVVTSPRFGTPGWWLASTLHAAGSTSA